MIAQVKCRRDQDGKGCLFCQKKGVRCNYSVKQKPSPKWRKREVQDLGPATEVTEAPNGSSTPQKYKHHSLVTGVAGNNGGFDASDGDGFGGVVGGENENPLMANSPSSTHLLRPSKKPKNMYDRDY